MGHVLTKKMNKNKEVREFKSKEEYFIKNGGILLERQISLSQGHHIGAGQLKIFSLKDIQKATNCFDSDLILRDATSFTVYKGILDDLTVVIKTPQEIKLNPELMDRFLTEISVGMVMNQGNLVNLYGCCLETYLPMPIYELVSGASNLFDNIHGEFAFGKSLKWAYRVRVLTDVSYALSYMHNALSKPVVHRDVRSTSILLDYSFNAKLCNFRHSVSVTPGDTSQRWPVEGTPGYIDPEYMETGEVTDKCDVYSFGVLMLELLTGRQPRVMAREGLDLVDEFITVVQRNCTMEMMDNEVLETGSSDEIKQVTQLALKCVEKKGIERPTMVEVVSKLWQM